MLTSLDFETYSQCDYQLTPDGLKWKSVSGAAKPGLAAVGAAVYAQHHSTEVLCMAYRLPGQQPALWVAGQPAPEALFEYIRAGGLVEAHNSGFEYFIWKYVCEERMDWPPLPQSQLRCTMSRARAWGLPGALGTVASILGADEQKDTEGTRLIKKFCMPRTPTKKDPRTRITPQDDPQDFERLCSYCLQDIATEDSISELLPPLIPSELTLWQADQRINQRGVAIDTEALHDLKTLVSAMTPALTAELYQLTNGAVNSASEVARIQGFLAALGVRAVTLDSEVVEKLLASELPPAARRVLEIRQALGSASVKKLGAIERMLCRDNRIRDMFQYCGAERTGRWAGRGPQPQNLPASGPELVYCESCKSYHSNRSDRFCWSCFSTAITDCEWTSDAVPSLLALATSRSLPVFQSQNPDVLGAIAGCLRGLFCSAPGHDLICADYSAIEAVVLAFMAGEEWRMEVFRTHGKIYEMSASKITGIPFEEFERVKRETGEHHPMRKKVGKVSELACLHSDTTVLTDSGPKYLSDVTTDDLLHDGTQWVRHGGIIDRGNRLTINLSGVILTPDHKIFTGDGKWETAEHLKQNTPCLKLALGLASSLLSEFKENQKQEGLSGLSVSVLAGGVQSYRGGTCVLGTPPDATAVQRSKPAERGPGMEGYAPTPSTESDSLTECQPQSAGAQGRTTRSTQYMGEEGLRYTLNGYETGDSGYPTFAPFRVGMTHAKRLTGLITTAGMSLVTYGLSVIRRNRTTNGRRGGLSMMVKECQPLSSTGCTPRTSGIVTRSWIGSLKGYLPRKLSGSPIAVLEGRTPRDHQQLSTTLGRSLPQETSTEGTQADMLRSQRYQIRYGGALPLRKLSHDPSKKERVFDILNAGPLNRFVILTNQGPLIVHNSGYQGGPGAWKAFGADKFLTDQEIQEGVTAWRAASPSVVAFWRGVENAAIRAVRTGVTHAYRSISYQVVGKVLYCNLPSGRRLSYHDPVVIPDTTPWGKECYKLTHMVNLTTGGWQRDNTYGGKLTENIVQAVARDLLANAIIGLEQAGYPVVMHIHDEIVCEVPEGSGSVKEMERIMGIMPPWAHDWPIRAAGGWRGKRYRK